MKEVETEYGREDGRSEGKKLIEEFSTGITIVLWYGLRK
jgi:hypothetical protein